MMPILIKEAPAGAWKLADVGIIERLAKVGVEGGGTLQGSLVSGRPWGCREMGEMCPKASRCGHVTYFPR